MLTKTEEITEEQFKQEIPCEGTYTHALSDQRFCPFDEPAFWLFKCRYCSRKAMFGDNCAIEIKNRKSNNLVKICPDCGAAGTFEELTEIRRL